MPYWSWIREKQDGLFGPVLWIRIQSDPKLLAGSEIIIFGSGSDKLPFQGTKIGMTSAEHPLVTVNFTVRTTKFTGGL